MEGRQLCQWDKDSCADAGFLKIDLLGLGMLSAVEECVETIADAAGSRSTSPGSRSTTRRVYREIHEADTVGVFQIESRAQMQMPARTRPENLDDLTVQVALVRPGRSRAAPSTRTSSAASDGAKTRTTCPRTITRCLAEPLADTLGVVVFQEQVLEVAMALAGFSVGEAEGLRRAMSRKRSRDAIEAYRERFLRRLRRTRSRASRRPSRCSRSSSASPPSASRSRTRPRLPCSPTSRHGCGITFQPSSCARS